VGFDRFSEPGWWSILDRPRIILIAHDSESVRTVIRKSIERETSYQVCEAADGLDAVRIGRALKPDLAILDVGMPGLTGIEAATILRYSMPRIRIVLVSLHSDDLYQTLCNTLTSTIHIDAVISKSEGITGLIESVKNLLDQPD